MTVGKDGEMRIGFVLVERRRLMFCYYSFWGFRPRIRLEFKVRICRGKSYGKMIY